MILAPGLALTAAGVAFLAGGIRTLPERAGVLPACAVNFAFIVFAVCAVEAGAALAVVAAFVWILIGENP
jgi:hypothetical protein